MKHASSAQKTAQTAASLPPGPTSSEGTALVPPAYGIDVLDRASGEPAFAQEPQAALPIGIVQMRADTSGADDQAQARPENRTGLPDTLKAGIESLSGLAMDDVRVHYNSLKPAQLQALAYTQGSEIHVAPGQERHLPHEAWHVVQQKRGQVQATAQLKGVNINDDATLEREASAMGARALQQSATGHIPERSAIAAKLPQHPAIQRLLKYPYDNEGNRLEGPPQQIDFNTATYQELINYKAIWNEKQLGAPHAQWVFENGDEQTLDRLIAAREADVNAVRQVICQEGEVKVALPGQSMSFGAITSCMAISLVLSDNTVISAHNGVFAPVGQDGGIARILGIKNARFRNLRIINVIAIGDGEVWDRSIKANGYQGFRRNQLVARDNDLFVATLMHHFAAPAGEFHQHDDGVARITVQRAYARG